MEVRELNQWTMREFSNLTNIDSLFSLWNKIIILDFVNKCTPKIKDKNHILFFKIYFFPVLYLHCFSVFSLVLVSSGHSGCGAHASHCNGFSSLAAEALERAGFSSFTSWALELWLRN